MTTKIEHKYGIGDTVWHIEYDHVSDTIFIRKDSVNVIRLYTSEENYSYELINTKIIKDEKELFETKEKAVKVVENEKREDFEKFLKEFLTTL